jgi:predicted nucleic acid-binding protein
VGEAIDAVDAAFRASDPIAIPAPVIMEMTRGWRARIDRGDARFVDMLRWFDDLLDEERVRSLPFDEAAAIVAGQIRARRPVAPAAWVLDIQIAATAWSWGYDVATPNRRDFEAIADELERLAPDAPRLEVFDPAF